MTSKLSFRARALDATKFLPIYCEHEIPDNADCSFINRAVPQMPTGMEKEEESEHHLQRAICTGTVIPTPEVLDIEDVSYYDRLYPLDYKMPRQLIYMQPFSMEADIPDYDMDSEDELWISSQSLKLELTPDKFEEMMDRLEKGSGQTVVTLQEAKALIKEDDDLIIAVYDYWLNKRLKTQHPLISQVRTEARFGVSNHNPYIAFRRRTEKMQTRKNRKNDESSYEKMLKLKRDLTRAVTLLEMVKRREKSKRELLHLSIEVFEKRYQIGDFSGHAITEALMQRPTRPIFSPLLQSNHLSWLKGDPSFGSITRKEKRHYKKRRHKSSSKAPNVASTSQSLGTSGLFSPQNAAFSREPSDEDLLIEAPQTDGEEDEEEGEHAFRRKKSCNYHPIRDTGSWYWCSSEEQMYNDRKYGFCPTSVSSKKSNNGYRYVGFCRRRIGRGGRVILDRMSHQNQDDFWRSMGYSVLDSAAADTQRLDKNLEEETIDSNNHKRAHFRPKTPTEEDLDLLVQTTPEEPDRSERIFEGVQSKPKSVTFGKYIGTVMVDEDNHEEPMIFEASTLLNDPMPHSLSRPCYLTPEIEQDICDTWNDELLQDIDFNNLDGESELSLVTDPWYSPVDPKIEDGNFHSTPVTDDQNQSNMASGDNSKEPCHPNSSDSENKDFTMLNSDQLTSIKTDDSINEISETHSEVDRRHSPDKDNKENDRIILSAQTRENLRTRGMVPEQETVVVNGDNAVDSSEECVIVEEQKSNFVLPSKQWMCNCIT